MGSDFKPIERRQPILGIVRNVPADSLDPLAWVYSQNIGVRDGELVKVKGYVERVMKLDDAVAKLDGVASLIRPIRLSTTIVTIICTNRWIYSLSVGNVLKKLNKDPFQAQPDQPWTVEYLGGNWYFTNISAGLWRWDGGGDLEDVTPDGVRGGGIAELASHLVLVNLATANSDGPQSIATSGLLNQQSLTVDFNFSDPGSDADILRIASGGDGILAVCSGGDWLEIYKETSVHAMGFVGGDDPFSLQKRDGVQGLLAQLAVIDMGEDRAYVGRDINLYRFNGSAPRTFGDRIATWLSKTMKPTARDLTYALRDGRFKEAHFAYNSVDGNGVDQSLVWNFQYDSFSRRDWPFVAAGLARKVGVGLPTFDELTTPMDEIGVLEDNVSAQDYDLVAATADGRVFTLDETTDTADGKSIEATLQSGSTDFGDYRKKMIKGMDMDVPVLTGSPLKVYVSARQHAGEPIRWQGPFLYREGGRVNFAVKGVWFDFKLVKTGGQLTLHGYNPRVKVCQ